MDQNNAPPPAPAPQVDQNGHPVQWDPAIVLAGLINAGIVAGVLSPKKRVLSD